MERSHLPREREDDDAERDDQHPLRDERGGPPPRHDCVSVPTAASGSSPTVAVSGTETVPFADHVGSCP
jgi:hypothetical protein